MSFFLSSPPQPTYHKPHNQSQPSFFTPQAHRTNYFPTTAWPTFQPKSPSPLRPSWNAANVMGRHPDTKGYGQDVNDRGDENVWGGAKESQQSESTGIAQHTSNEQPICSTTPFTTASIDPFHNSAFTTQIPNDHNSAPSSATTTRNPFQFASRAQASTSTAQISSRIKNGRDTRRDLFLDRLRSTRRDERDTRNIDKFEKTEYWREKRAREERMEREAQQLIGMVGDEDEDMLVVEDGREEEYGLDAGEISPVDEERELGMLVEGWYQGHGQDEGQDQNSNHHQHQYQQQTHSLSSLDQDDEFMDGASFDFEDPDVEEAFMQVLSQQQQQNQPTQDPQDKSQSSLDLMQNLEGQRGDTDMS